MDFLEFEETDSLKKEEKEDGQSTPIFNISSQETQSTAVSTAIPTSTVDAKNPFDRDDDSEGKSVFGFLELDKKEKKKIKKEKLVVCPNCGAANSHNNDFCYDCQGELVKFRQVEFDTKPIKVVLKFPKNIRFKFCGLCGASNEISAVYCKDCCSAFE
ncbi:MAG: zinc ribbon domain-containing protein [Candidatus Eremiobacteraeota bacterium]|nr:zinc ribbon domain-containing protein [Candidatus Eremiobacteraeota bacterium]